MEKSFLGRLNLYDHFGYLFVGLLALGLGWLNLVILRTNFNISSSAYLLLVVLALAYFFGHLIQALANVVIKENKTDFTQDEKEVLNEVRKFFKQEVSDKQAFQYCYTVAVAKDITAQVQLFNAYYSLFRGWALVLLLESVFCIGAYLFVSQADWVLLPIAFLAIGSSLLFYKRSKRFYMYVRSKVLQTFVTLKALGLLKS